MLVAFGLPERYDELFERNNVHSLERILECTDKEFELIGIEIVHRKRMFDAIQMIFAKDDGSGGAD
jgi:hypothetical protein